MELAKSERINNLFDIYQKLLTPYQQEIMINYYQEDLSLAEIAEINQISRNAVFTTIHRVEKILEDYEEALHLLDKYERILKLISDEKLLNEVEKIIED